MGFWKDLAENVATLGGKSRIDKRLKEYDDRVKQLMASLDRIEGKRKKVEATFEALVFAKLEAVEVLQRVKEVSDNLTAKERDAAAGVIAPELPQVNFGDVDRTLEVGQTVLKSGWKGATAGFSTAAGAWALVGSVGAASTGTAISTLSGVAATNATLAWFGGGALAAGGGGIAAGTVVLGGLAVVPALVIMGVFSHVDASKKINEIAREEQKVIQGLMEADKAFIVLEAMDRRSLELIDVLKLQGDVLSIEITEARRRLNCMSARLCRWFRFKFTGKKFSKKELLMIGKVGSLATSLALSIDKKIMEEDGTPA